MSDQKMIDRYKAGVEGTGVLILRDVMTVNHKPHPYTIGPKHVVYAADHCGGGLGEDTIRKIPCAVPGCRLTYDQHTYDRVFMISLARNCKFSEVKAALTKFTESHKAAIEHDKIDGFTFVKNEFDWEDDSNEVHTD